MRPDTPSVTARLVAFVRAALSAAPKKSPLYDPYAQKLLPLPMRLMSEVFRVSLASALLHGFDRSFLGLLSHLAGRTCFFDEKLSLALEEGIQQVVILGAGYDTRALRLKTPGVRFFEVDHPATQADKKARLLALGEISSVTLVPVDFTRDNLRVCLKQAGFLSAKQTFFLWEGVTMYLSEEQVRATLRTLHELAAPGSFLALEVMAHRMRTTSAEILRTLGHQGLSLLGEPFRFGIDPEDLEKLLSQEGWRLREIEGSDDLFSRYLKESFLHHPPTGPLGYVALGVRG